MDSDQEVQVHPGSLTPRALMHSLWPVQGVALGDLAPHPPLLGLPTYPYLLAGPPSSEIATQLGCLEATLLPLLAVQAAQALGLSKDQVPACLEASCLDSRGPLQERAPTGLWMTRPVVRGNGQWVRVSCSTPCLHLGKGKVAWSRRQQRRRSHVYFSVQGALLISLRRRGRPCLQGEEGW